MNLTKAEKRKLKARLKFGDIAKVARLAQMSRSSVTRWLNGQGSSPEIAEAFVILFKRRENAEETLRKSL